MIDGPVSHNPQMGGHRAGTEEQAFPPLRTSDVMYGYGVGMLAMVPWTMVTRAPLP
jgi:hypothetical protein